MFPRCVLIFTYTFALGVGLGFVFSDSVKISPFLMIGAAIPCGICGWYALWLRGRGNRLLPDIAIYTLLFLSALCLGWGRFTMKAAIAPFDPAGKNHVAAVLEAYPDIERTDRTRIVGTIDAEPEYRPVLEKPGKVLLTIRPHIVAPQGDLDRKVEIAEGNLLVTLSPQEFRKGDNEFQELFAELAGFDAYGYTIEIDAHFDRFKQAENPGQFDEEIFQTDHEIFARATISYWDKKRPPVVIRKRTEGNPIIEFSLALKKRMLGVIKQTVPFPASAFLAGVTLGSDRGLDGVRCIFEESETFTGERKNFEHDTRLSIKDEFGWAGTTHVLSVSGLHVTIIASALWGLFVLARMPKHVYAPIIVMCLIVFAFITGAEPPTNRAVIMNSLVLLTYVYLGTGLRASLLMAIGVAAFAILMGNPKWIFQASFALSFMAMLSLGLLTEPSASVLSKIIPGFTRLPVWLQSFLGAQIAIQFGMMWPLGAHYFARNSFSGPISNMIAIPLSDLIIQLGLFASLIGMIPGIGLHLALVMNAGNYLLIWFFLWAQHLATVLAPYPFIQTMTPRMLVAYYILMGFYAWHVPLLRHLRIYYYDLVMGIGGAPRRRAAAAALGAAIIVPAVVGISGFWPKKATGDLHLNVLSVGFGQSVHIETPGGAQILIDAGPNDFRSGWDIGERVVAPYLLKSRIGKLDAVVMSSVSPEDIGGLAAILRIFPTRRFYSQWPIWEWPAENEDEFFATTRRIFDPRPSNDPDFYVSGFHLREVARQLKEKWPLTRQIETLLVSPTSFGRIAGPPRTHAIEAGDVIWEEDHPSGRFELVALYPHTEATRLLPNERSLVLRASFGSTRYLIAGDLTEEGIAELRRLPPELLKADFLVVPSHGAGGGILNLAEQVFEGSNGLKYAAVSTGWGRDLRVEHRDKERGSFLAHRRLTSRDLESTVAQFQIDLAKMGVIVARTDELGAIMTRSDGSSLRVTSMRREDVGNPPRETLAAAPNRIGGFN